MGGGWQQKKKIRDLQAKLKKRRKKGGGREKEGWKGKPRKIGIKKREVGLLKRISEKEKKKRRHSWKREFP